MTYRENTYNEFNYISCERARKKNYRAERARKNQLQNYYSQNFEKFVEEFFDK
jgi:hypothetical protein